MRSIVDDFLAGLRTRFAECPVISLTLEGASDGLKLIGAFEVRLDGIARRHVFHLPHGPARDADRQLRDLLDALRAFEGAIEGRTRGSVRQ